jgi:probable rRNA maturation factor
MIQLTRAERRIRRAELERFVRAAQRAVGLRGAVEVLLTDDAQMRRLNASFRGKRKATDVLSFPAEGVAGLAGDIAISLDIAVRQAAEQRHSLQTEVKVLLLHGLLHLAGMDHETDDGAMREREAKLRVKLKLPAGLIARGR